MPSHGSDAFSDETINDEGCDLFSLDDFAGPNSPLLERDIGCFPLVAVVAVNLLLCLSPIHTVEEAEDLELPIIAILLVLLDRLFNKDGLTSPIVVFVTGHVFVFKEDKEGCLGN